MDKDRTHVTERILDLTLEIIFLLTREEYKVVKKISGAQLTPNGCHPRISPNMVPAPPCPTTEVTSAKKILEVTKKITELLTGEVPIRCQDVTVYFSMEEWEYLEGHKELYEDVMMASQPAFTSPDGSSNGNRPEGCPRPLYSQDSTQEGDTIMMASQLALTSPGKEDWEYLEGHKELYKDVMMVSQPALISPDGSINGNPPERCPRPLNSQDTSQEDLAILHHHQAVELKVIKVEVKEEEINKTLVSGDQPSMEEEEMIIKSEEEESSLHQFTDGSFVWDSSDGHHVLTMECYDDNDDITRYPPEVNPVSVTPDSHLRSYGVERTTDPSDFKGTLSDGVQSGANLLSSLMSGDIALDRHEKSDTAHRPYSCSECGKRFIRKGHLQRHMSIHTGERPFSCPECGKCYTCKSKLIIHQRSHTGERPFSCSECGQCFSEKGSLIRHQKTHTGERPFFCSECGKGFTRKLQLNMHWRSHTGYFPFSCTECGKSFTRKSVLLRHQSIHKGVNPFVCSECGKAFSNKGSLMEHYTNHILTAPLHVESA